MALTKKQKDEMRQKFFSPTQKLGDAKTQRKQRVQQIVEKRVAKAPEEKERPGFFGRLLERGKESISDVKESFARSERGVLGEEDGQTPVETGLQVVGEAVGFGVETAFDAVFSGAKKLADVVTAGKSTEMLGSAGDKFVKSQAGQLALRAANSGVEAYEGFKKEHPRTAANFEAVMNIAELIPAKKGVTAGTQTMKRLKDVGEEVVETGVDVLRKADIGDVLKTRRIKNIAKEITPVPTKKEVRRAIEEGRKVEVGKVRRLLGKGDKITPEKRVMDAAEVVERRIKNATKISDQEIATQAKKEITSIAKNLEPKLRKIELEDQIKNDILGSWDDIKFRQIDELEDLVLSPRQIKKAQKQFEDTILEIIDAKDADDLWKVVQNYDKRVGKKVKEATSQSSDVLQAQQDMWRENRRILREALDDVAEGITEVDVSDAFRDMRGLYTARTNIINNAKMQKGSQIWKRLAQTGILAGAGAAGFNILE